MTTETQKPTADPNAVPWDKPPVSLLPPGVPEMLDTKAIPVEHITVRQSIPPSDELVESIRRVGVIEPIIVMASPTKDGDKYEVVAGRRRLAAAKKAGLETIPARVMKLREDWPFQRSYVALAENALRSSNALAEVQAVENALKAGAALADIARDLGLSKATLDKRVALVVGLHPDVLAAMKKGQVGQQAALTIAKLPKGEQVSHLKAITNPKTGKATAKDAKESVKRKRNKASGKLEPFERLYIHDDKSKALGQTFTATLRDLYDHTKKQGLGLPTKVYAALEKLRIEVEKALW